MDDRELFERTLCNYAIIVSHSDENHKTKLQLPSGSKKTEIS